MDARELVVDNFAGGGGASTGIRMALGRDVDIAINHDESAIAMHKINHPTAVHYQEDVWAVDPVKACAGRPVGLAWFSPDCKHFSKAKGGKPCDKNIRGLAWVAVKWAKLVRPRVIMMENVEEIQTWGPLLPNGRPDPAHMGETYRRFIGSLERLGYHVETRELVAADYGAPTTRKRWFLIARCDGAPVVWPQPTHLSRSENSGMLPAKPWKPVADVIDWSLPCPSIFDTKSEIKEKYGFSAVRPLSDKTLARIARGIKRFVLDNPHPFIVSINHGGNNFRGQDIDEPLSTITAKRGMGICCPSIIQYHSEHHREEASRGQPVDRPIMTLDASNRYAVVSAFMHKYYDGGYTGAGCSLDAPLPTVTAIDHNSLVCAFLTQFNNHCNGQDVREPINTVTAGQGHFGEVRAFLLKYYGTEGFSSIEEPMPTQTTKDRFGLVTISGTEYAIVDIGLRMLTPRELFDAQGFPHGYEIERGAGGRVMSKAEQVARCGNAVCPQLAEALVRANLPEMCIAAA